MNSYSNEVNYYSIVGVERTRNPNPKAQGSESSKFDLILVEQCSKFGLLGMFRSSMFDLFQRKSQKRVINVVNEFTLGMCPRFVSRFRCDRKIASQSRNMS